MRGGALVGGATGSGRRCSSPARSIARKPRAPCAAAAPWRCYPAPGPVGPAPGERDCGNTDAARGGTPPRGRSRRRPVGPTSTAVPVSPTAPPPGGLAQGGCGPPQGGTGNPRLGKPDPLAAQLTDHVERLRAFLRVPAVDAPPHVAGPVLLPTPHQRILLSGGQHLLVPLPVVLQRVCGEVALVAVEQFGAALRHRPMPCDPPVPDPAKDLPPDQPAGHGEPQLGCGVEGPTRVGTRLVGTMPQLANQRQGSRKRKDVVLAMIAHRTSYARKGRTRDPRLPVPLG